MTRTRTLLPFLGALALASLLGASTPAAAIEMTVFPTNIRQANTGGGVYLGHTVSASTNMNRLYAGGTFATACNDPRTLPLTGQRSLSAEGLTGPRNLAVTVPETVPALRTIPGFSSVEYGVELTCTYNWTARASEATYSFGTGGGGVNIGGAERSDGSTILFQMLRSDGTSRGCIRD